MKELLKDKVAIITGSGRGIGKGIAKFFVSQGAKVVINDIDPVPCKETADEINASGGEALACPCDVTNKEQVDGMVADAIAKYGKIDILVNNAGTSRDALIHKMDDKLLRFIIDVNLKGTHVCTQAVMPEFTREDRMDEFKKIINFSSSTGVSGNVGQANYAIAKGGIIAYTKATAREFARYRVCINAIAPGFVETRMTQEKLPGMKLGVPAAIRNIAISAMPFSREGKGGLPSDIARIVGFFSCDLSNWVTGQLLMGDGGTFI
ncbi:MAG: SDR family NAD(P)-dependent oxidoreductase [Promethearchaeota archaeon]